MLKNNYNFERRQNCIENMMLKFEFLGNNENEQEFLTNEFLKK